MRPCPLVAPRSLNAVDGRFALHTAPLHGQVLPGRRVTTTTRLQVDRRGYGRSGYQYVGSRDFDPTLGAIAHPKGKKDDDENADGSTYKSELTVIALA